MKTTKAKKASTKKRAARRTAKVIKLVGTPITLPEPEMLPPLFAFKFIIADGDWKRDPANPDVEFCGAVAVSIAATEEEARTHVERYAAENGLDIAWLSVAKVAQIPLIAGAVLAWAEA